MGNQSDEQLPPGMHSQPSSTPLSSSDEVSYLAANSGSNLFPFPLPNTPTSSSSETFNSQHIQRFDASELATLQPPEISNGSEVQYERSTDIDAATQSAVLHEQVSPFKLCCTI